MAMARVSGSVTCDSKTADHHKWLRLRATAELNFTNWVLKICEGTNQAAELLRFAKPVTEQRSNLSWAVKFAHDQSQILLERCLDGFPIDLLNVFKRLEYHRSSLSRQLCVL